MNRADRHQDDNGLGDSGRMEEAGDMHGGNRRRSRADMLADKVKRYGIALKHQCHQTHPKFRNFLKI